MLNKPKNPGNSGTSRNLVPFQEMPSSRDVWANIADFRRRKSILSAGCQLFQYLAQHFETARLFSRQRPSMRWLVLWSLLNLHHFHREVWNFKRKVYAADVHKSCIFVSSTKPQNISQHRNSSAHVALSPRFILRIRKLTKGSLVCKLVSSSAIFKLSKFFLGSSSVMTRA